jgi:pantoate--beta-alanine ligase
VELIRDAAAFSAAMDAWRSAGSIPGFVPTMGALHGGHASLIRRAREEHEHVAVSIYVNPLQFGPDDDHDRYPRNEKRDLEMCVSLGVDGVWAPPVEEVYPPGLELLSPDPGPVGDVFEGAARPGHFAGVLEVVYRLFEVAGPSSAYFGEKDAQQLFLVRQMVNSLDLPIQVVACPTVREPDGLAISSRNGYLTPDEREQAACLFLALTEAAELAHAGDRDAHRLVAAMAREIGVTPLASLDYAAVVDEATFGQVDDVEGPARAIVAARFPSARLLDNLLLPTPAA